MSIRHVLALTLAAGLAACGGAQQKTEQPSTTAPSEQQPPAGGTETPPGAENAPQAGMCPMEVPGTQVTVEDAEGGVALRFTTTGDTAEVRRRVEQMAAMQQAHAGMMGQNGTAGERNPVGGQPEMMTIPHTARVEDVEGGARLVLTPSDPGQLDDLRTATRDMATKMQTGQCPMMQAPGSMEQGGGDTGTMPPGGMSSGGGMPPGGEDTGTGE